MSAWLAWVKSFLAQLAQERAEMLSVGDEKAEEGAQPIPFWLWHMF
jgi:hypothetical protein